MKPSPHVYETNADDPNLYRYGDGWEPLQRFDEIFAVKGETDQVLTLSFSKHGPILFEDKTRRRAVGLRSVWSAPGTAPYLGSLSTMRARTVADFAAALDTWRTPSVNHVCADVDGTIGWFTAGLVPIRHIWEGLLPVAGDGRFEWAHRLHNVITAARWACFALRTPTASTPGTGHQETP